MRHRWHWEQPKWLDYIKDPNPSPERVGRLGIPACYGHNPGCAGGTCPLCGEGRTDGVALSVGGGPVGQFWNPVFTLGCKVCGWWLGCRPTAPGHELCLVLGGCYEWNEFQRLAGELDVLRLMHWRLLGESGYMGVLR